MISRRTFLKLGAGVGAGMLVPHGYNVGRLRAQAGPLDPRTLTKYIDPLPIPGPMGPAGTTSYEIGAYRLSQQLHSQLPATNVWGYGTSAASASYPAATLEVRRGTPISVRWTNNLGTFHPLQIDPTLHWADPDNNSPAHMATIPPGFTYSTPSIPIVTHVHGGEQAAASDGHPDAWFTPGFAKKGPGWVQETFNYPNEQPAATLWYHDHALGITRLNVYMGLAGYYIVRDPGNEPALPAGAFEIPLVIQDRLFDAAGQLVYPALGDNPDVHPFWIPEFFGDTILVNGKVWPFLEVTPGKYRFRILNGSNARFYELQMQNRGGGGGGGPVFTQIGTDGGYLGTPAPVQRLLIAPGERCDVVIDFSAYSPGTEFILRNSARSPFPQGGTPDPQTNGQVMLFRVVAGAAYTDPLPNVLNPALATYPSLPAPAVTRTFTLNELMGVNGPLAAFLNNTPWFAPASESIPRGQTELWEIVNLTADAHPIHLHLTQFQLVNRQRFNVNRYARAFDVANPPAPMGGMPPPYVPVPVGRYIQGPALPPAANERGWKDTVRMMPGEVTRILVRAAPIGGGAYPFDATAAPGYVWHCHILEHEDNEMMRPYHIT